LLRNFLPYSYYNGNPFLPTQGKRKTLQSSFKAATLFLAYSVFVFNFCNLFRRCGYNPYALIAHAVKQRVELPPLRRFLGCLIREKELVYLIKGRLGCCPLFSMFAR